MKKPSRSDPVSSLPPSSTEAPRPLTETEIILKVRADSGVIALQTVDPDTEIYVSRLEADQIHQINEEFPNFLPSDLSYVWSVNIISAQMRQGSGYKKIRFYLSPEGNILGRYETGK